MRADRLLKRRHSTLKKWMAYYALILVLPLALGLFVYADAVKLINNQVEQAHKASLNQLKIVLDGKMGEIYQIAREISLDEKVRSLTYKKPPVEGEIRYMMHEVRQDFVKYMISNRYIKSIGIYFSGIGYMMTDTDTIGSDNIRATVEDDFFIDYKTWQETVSQHNYRNFEMINSDDENNEIAESMILFQTVSMPDGRNSPSATLMILVDLDELRLLMNGIRTDEEEIFIRDSISGLYLKSGDALRSGNTIDFDAFGNDGIIVSNTQSQFTEWEYITALPSYIYLRKVKHIKTVIIIYIAVCLALGSSLAYYLARRSYNPLKRLIQKTIQNGGGAYLPNQNEFNFLEHTLDDLLYEKESFINRLRSQRGAIRNNLVAKIVKGSSSFTPNFLSKCKANGIYFPEDYFFVISFSVEEIGEKFMKDDLELDEDSVELVNFVVFNIAEEITNENHTGYMAEVDGMMVCIVNYKKSMATDTAVDMNNEIIYLSIKVQNMLRQYFDISVFTAISNVYTGMENIPKAYAETLEIIEYKNFVGKNEKMMDYNSINIENENSMESSSLISSERQFMNLIAKGDYKNAQLLLENIFSHYTPENLPSLQIAKCRVFSLVNCMLNSLGNIKSTVDVGFFEELDPVHRLLNSKNIQELRGEVCYIFNSIIEYFEQKNSKNIVPKIAKILDYIKDHHAEFDLSACVIAEEFDITTSYLSRIFNKNMNMGFVDYIHKVRLENAKVLMPTNLSVKEIAEKVGYNSSLALIRAFKKYEGVTPGKYREGRK